MVVMRALAVLVVVGVVAALDKSNGSGSGAYAFELLLHPSWFLNFYLGCE